MQKRKTKRIVIAVMALMIAAIGLRVALFSSNMNNRIKTPSSPGPDEHDNAAAFLKPGQRVLFVAAHPDDAEFYAGATLARLKERGDHVTLLVITTGGKEKYGIHAWSRYLTRTRRKEQERAGSLLGYQDIIFWNYPDGKLPPFRKELIPKIEHVIDQVHPQMILAYDSREPWGYRHPDHVTGGLATLEALQRDHSINPKVFLYASGKPNTWINVTETINEKWKGIRAHRSQFGTVQFYLIKNKLLQRLAEREGQKIHVSYAETFRRVQVDR